MASYKTPGVYIEEHGHLPRAVIGVATAIPAFIGFTEKALDLQGASLTNIPTRINSLSKYEQLFGRAPKQVFRLDLTQRQSASTSEIIDTHVAFSGEPLLIPDYQLYYSMLLFFANGGEACYVVSVGDTSSTAYSTSLFTSAITTLEAYDEPTLYLFPDACSHRPGHEASDADVADIIDAALLSCARLHDRFTIADVRNAVVGGTETNADINRVLRDEILSDAEIIKYGAAYFPYLDTNLTFFTADDAIRIASHTLISVAEDGSEALTAGGIAAGTAVSDASVVTARPEVYAAATAFVRNARVTLPPSGAIAAVYTRVDNERGVWNAPANVSLTMVNQPSIAISNALNGELNVDPVSRKSVNAIRDFPGRGVLVWGARTLAGMDNEWRYVPTRRFFNFVEESVKKGCADFSGEANNANTWVAVRSLIENFLMQQWREGALRGSTPKEAYFVRVGLGETMTAADIANGDMIVEIGMALIRPAEFSLLRFTQQVVQT